MDLSFILGTEFPHKRGLLGSVIEFLQSLYHPDKLIELIHSGGYVVLAGIVFAETGLFVGFFLPGDSLLFTAGLVASQGFFEVGYLMVLLSIMAVVGDAVGFSIGYRTGLALYEKQDSLFFKRKHLLCAKEFYDRHGGKAIFLARFVPFARTFAPVVAGIAQMSYPRFAAYNVFGGIFWVCTMVSAGFFLGNIPLVRHHLEKVILLIIFVSVLPIIVEYWRNRMKAGRKAQDLEAGGSLPTPYERDSLVTNGPGSPSAKKEESRSQ
jgi:membrane-associated protein